MTSHPESRLRSRRRSREGAREGSEGREKELGQKRIKVAHPDFSQGRSRLLHVKERRRREGEERAKAPNE